MAPRKKKTPAANDQPPASLELLKESYQALQEFHQTVTEKAQGVSPNRFAGANNLSIFQQLLEHFKTIIDHQTGNQKDDARLVKECSRLCDFFRHQVASLYALPLKNIFAPIKPAFPVTSSPILGLMSYIYEAKLERCRAPFSLVRETRFKDDSEHIGQCWERILAAFGEGIRIFMNNAQHGTKTSQFQILVGNVFYPFLAHVAGFQNSTNPHRLSEYVKRSLLDAGEALSGGSAENKELIRDPTIFGPAILSHIIFNHSDFITANTALQLAFVVAPPLKMGKGLPKGVKAPIDTKTARRNWFIQIFPAEKFGKPFQEEMVSQLVSMSSKQFWVGLGDIQDKIFQNDHSRACAMRIQSGSILDNKIRFNTCVAPIFNGTVQFNKHSLTWSCLVAKPGDDLVNESEEITAEICYNAILAAQLSGISNSSESMPQYNELTLSIEFSGNFPVHNCAPMIHYAPDSDAIGATLVLKLQSQYADAILSILREQQIQFSYAASCGQSPLTDDDKDTKIVDVESDRDPPQTIEKIKRETSKISISKEPVCSWEAENPLQAPPHPNSHQRVESVQREAGINSSREEDSNSGSEQIIDSGKRQCRSSSVTEEPNLISSPTVVHTRTPMSLKRKGRPMVSSPVVDSCTRQQLGQEQKSKRIRIIESPNDSIHSPPAYQSRKDSENKSKTFPHSVLRQTRGTKVKIPLLKPMNSDENIRQKSDTRETKYDMNHIEDLILSRKQLKKPARAASEDIIESYSEAEEKEASIRSESIDLIPDDYGQIMTGLEPEPTSRHESDVEDEIIRSSQSSDHTMEMKIAKTQPGRKFKEVGHLSVMDLASGFRSATRKEEVGRIRKTQTKFWKHSNEAQTGPLEGWNPKIASEFKPKKISPTKHRLERDTFSPEVEIIEKAHASFQSPTYDSDIRAEHCKNVTNRKEPNGKKPQYKSRISNTHSQYALQKDENTARMVSDSKTKKPTKYSIPSIFAGFKKTLQTPSSVDLTTRKTFNPFKDSLKTVKISEASGSKGLGGVSDMGVASSTPLSRMQLEGAERRKKFMRKCEDPLKAKQLRFESPRNALAPQNTSKTRSHKRGLSKRDYPSPVEEDHISEDEILQSIKQRKFQPDILSDNKDLLKSALKTSTPSRPTPRFDLKNFQKSEKKRIGSSSMVEVEQEVPDGLYRSPSVSEKLLDRPKKETDGSPSKRSDLRNETDKPWERDVSSCMNQLSEMVVAGIKNKQVKIQGAAATNQLGVLNSTDNLVKEFDSQSEAITDRIAQRAHHTQNEYKQHHNDIKQHSEKIEQDVNWMKDYIKERNKDTFLEA
ncbi:hypothetical protein PGTUg99_001079 [Puccinia graminis f. sp. tritici]|uniref:Uncharacterized protein n=1 Tax=Puccinia graminis f. sp. tritici TaxID=56615 RepID=A0A5B0QGZ0_PUCGR|nr:hypothetical protein PGTUg99_001079 [Puccinia graminis f. sp. tritici]